MVHQFKALVSLSEDLSSSPSIHMVPVVGNPKGLGIYMILRHLYKQNTYVISIYFQVAFFNHCDKIFEIT